MGVYRDLTPRLAFVTLVGALGATSMGFDQGWWGLILGSGYFNDQYGSLHTVTKAGVVTSLTATEQSIGTSISAIGAFIGNLLTPWFNERIGRKKCFAIGSVICIIGALTQALSTMNRQFWVLVAGKLILNIAVGIYQATVPVYLGECAPKSLRGAVVSAYNICLGMGQTVAAGVMYGVILETSIINWLLPICLQMLWPLLLLFCNPFIPESPRWLVDKDRLEEAEHVLRSLRSSKDAASDEVIRLEVLEMQAAHAEIRAIANSTTWLELFRGTNARRTSIAVMALAWNQFMGVGFAASYILLLLLNLGIQNPYLIAFLLYAVFFISMNGAFYFPDKFGRRTILLTGGLTCGICMGIVGAVSAAFPAPVGGYANLIVFALFLWVVANANSWSPVSWCVTAEAPSTALREKTVALSSAVAVAIGLAVTLVSPYVQDPGYGNLGGKIGFVWMGFSFCAVIYCWFFIPEFKGRQLEELDYMFEMHISVRQFKRYDTSAMLAEKRREHGTSIEKEDVNQVGLGVGDDKHEVGHHEVSMV